MQTKAYNEISIKEICSKAGLSRMTFYNLFANKDEIISFYLKDKLNTFLMVLESSHSFRLKDLTMVVSSYLSENKLLFKLLYDNKLDSIITYSISICISVFVEKMIPSLNDKKTKYVDAFLSGAIANILLYWLKDDMSISTKELSAIILEIFSGGYYEQMKDLIELG